MYTSKYTSNYNCQATSTACTRLTVRVWHGRRHPVVHGRVVPHGEAQAVHGVGGVLEVGHAAPQPPLGAEGTVVRQSGGRRLVLKGRNGGLGLQQEIRVLGYMTDLII